jgi:DNA-binding transcriptional LysR family regulator
MNFSVRDLRALIALVEERNFTRAAERVHLSQSAFSTLIRTMERSLGARLFDRSTRNVAPTAEGKLLESSARRLLSDFEEMIGDFRDHSQRRKGRIGIAAMPSLAAWWLPGVLAEYHALYPGIDLGLVDAHSERCLSLLRSGQVDLAIASAGDKDTDLVSEALCSDKFYLICRKSHPLARRKSVRPRDLAEHPFLHLTRNTSVRNHLDEALRSVPVRIILEVELLATLAGLVEAGLGITVVPALTLVYFAHPDLAVRPVMLKGLSREVLIVRRKSEPLSAAAQAMRDLMKQRQPQPHSGPRSAPLHRPGYY